MLREIIWLMARYKIKRKFMVFKECLKLFITLYVDSTVMHSVFFTATNLTRLPNHDRIHPNYIAAREFISL